MPADDEVREANAAFYRAFNTKDLAAMNAIWAEEAAVTCVHPGWFLLEGRDLVLESYQGILGNVAQPRIVVGGVIATTYGDLAVVVCREFVGGAPLLATNLFVREGGEWRIFHHHSGPVAQLEQA
ncbi:MAG: nuclear transport factor 2 family protein [Dehalococcoidia bacterium]|nr:nuclear transport factor 2 family protein [Dehalococcoidia bacterium]